MNHYWLFYGDSLYITDKYISSGTINLIYIDPPFNTGKEQKRINNNKKLSYSDSFWSSEEYINFLEERISDMYRTLHSEGSFFLHIDYRESHRCKLMLDNIFGEDCFQNEIIWAYDFGGRSKKKWPCKHDSIFWYTKDPKKYTFNYDEIDRIPYMAPGLVGKEKAAKGKTPTDVWWHTIVGTQSKEKTGYPTQKPLGILNRIVKVHSNENDLLLDCFAGSGSFGVAAANLKRNCYLIDKNPEAIPIILDRMEKLENVPHVSFWNREPYYKTLESLV